MPAIHELTDEQIMGMAPPPVDPADVGSAPLVPEVKEKTQEELDAEAAATAEAERVAAEAAAADNGGKDTAGDGIVPPNGEATDDTSGSDAAGTEGQPAQVKGEGETGNDTQQGDGKTTPPAGSGEGAATEIDYKAAYEQMMAPFTANGKKVELRDPKELIQLAQMGANYTAKMQALAPMKKQLLMLQNNGLLNDADISFFIDLKNKNPEAIKKLIKESKIDPRDIDVDSEVAYQAGNHSVSDQQVAFSNALEEVQTSATGAETLKIMNGWDQASKDAMWAEPSIMTAIHQQRENGVYAVISAEVDRRRMLGQIPQGTSFLAAYKAVGDEMMEQAKAATPPATQQPVATRAAAVKPVVANGTKASAASPTRVAPAKATAAPINPLALSDEEFAKLDQYAGKV